jgi:hypothetical protein
MKDVLKAFGTIALAAVIVFTTAACSKKDSGSSSNGGGKAASASDFSYDLTADWKGILIKGYTGKSAKIVVPAKIEDLPVTEIGNDAFNGKSMTINLSLGEYGVGSEKNERSAITSITIPNTVTTIGNEAFANTAITKFNMPDSVTKLDYEASYGCEQLTELRLSDNITQLRTVGGTALGGALKSLKKVNLPANLESICDDAFSSCGELSESIIPESIKSVKFLYKRTRDKFVKPNEDYHWLMFIGCSKLPIKTRQIIKGWGYEGNF